MSIATQQAPKLQEALEFEGILVISPGHHLCILQIMCDLWFDLDYVSWH